MDTLQTRSLVGNTGPVGQKLTLLVPSTPGNSWYGDGDIEVAEGFRLCLTD